MSETGRPAGASGIGRRAFGNRVAWGVVDQALFSATSFALAIGIANRTTATNFGAFGVAYVVYTLVLGAVEAFTGDVVAVRGSHLPDPERHAMLARAAGTAVVLGCGCSAVGLVFLLFVHGTASDVVAPLLVPAPLLFVQDVWRFGFFATARPRSAALNDLLWAVLFAACFLLVPNSGGDAWLGLVWGWSAAGAVCGVVGAVQLRCRPRPAAILSWVRDQSRAGGRFAGEYLALYGAGQSVLIWVGLFAGLAESAGYRGATLLFGPVQVTINAVRIAVTPLVVRAHQSGSANAAWRGGIATAVCAAVLALVWGIVLVLLPTSVGEAILGESWGATRPVLPFMLWVTVAQGVGLGAVVLLRVLGAYRQSFHIRIAGAFLIALFGAVGATIGATAAAGGAAFAATLTVIALWWRGHRIVSRAALDRSRAPLPASDGTAARPT